MDENKLLKIGKSLRRGFGLVHEGRNNLATYAKISQPLDVAEMSEVKLKRVISECCGFMQPEADRKSCLILYSFPYLKPIWGNPALLRSAILNLLDNAIKYSYEGREIAVDIREDASGTIQLVVENYGVGIPHSDLNRVFQPYFRSKVPDEKGARSGSGIGLAIVWHAIVVGHAGQVSVESIPPRKIRDLSPTLSAAETAKYPHKTTFTLILERKTLDEMRRKSTNV
jgi:signal transduction histidine kinase